MSAVLKRGVKVGNRLSVKLVHVNELHIDASYQRSPSQGNLENIGGDAFNPLALGALLVGKRVKTGLLNVIDGQHRLAVIKSKLENGEDVNPYVLCHVIEGTTQQEEADLFVLFNTNKPVTGNIRFRARLLCKYNPEARIEEIVKNYGFTLLFLPAGKPRANLPVNGLRGEGVMLKAYKDYGEDKFTMAIKILRECFSTSHVARQGMFIYGLCVFLSKQAVTEDSLTPVVKRLKGTDPNCGVQLAEKECRYSTAKYNRIGEWLADVCGVRRAA